MITRPIPRFLPTTPQLDSGQIGNVNMSTTPLPKQSELLKLQTEFSCAIALLLVYINISGYKCTLADAYDTDGDGGHMRNSNHQQRLALDINLFVNGAFVMTDSKEYRQIGNFWKSVHPLARWGGEFTTKDCNHFSFEYLGVK